LVHAELAREVIERQAFGIPQVRRRGRAGSQEHVRRNRPQAAVPHAKRIQGNVDKRGTCALRELGGTPRFAQSGHDVHTMPCRRRTAKATSGIPGR
jgi:hypothetical protein